MNDRDIPRISLAEKLGFCGFSTASNVVYQFKSLYYLFFLTNVLKVNMLTAGLVLTIGTVWDAVNDPLVGFWAQNHVFKSGERCRPLALYAAIPWAVSVVLLFTDFGTGRQLTVILCIAIYFVFELLNTCVAIPYNSMAALATDRDDDRRSINVYRNIGGCVGSGIGAVACLPLLKLFGALDSKGNLIEGSGGRGFLLAACVMGGVCVVGCFLHYFTTRERVAPLEEKRVKLSVRTIFSMLFSCKSWVLNTLYILLYGVNNLLLMSCISYYATYVLNSTAAATPIQAAYLVTSLVTSFLVSPVDKALGRHKTMIAGALVFILGKIWFVLDPFSLGAIYVNAISVGVGATVAFVMFNTNRNNIVDVIEWKRGQRLDNMVSTADNLAAKLATAGASLLITFSMEKAGFSVDLPAQPDSVISVINALLSVVPMAVCLLMLLVVIFLRLDKDMGAMRRAKAQSK